MFDSAQAEMFVIGLSVYFRLSIRGKLLFVLALSFLKKKTRFWILHEDDCLQSSS